MTGRYFECQKCSQVVQGREASWQYSKPCVDGPFHKWKEVDGPEPYPRVSVGQIIYDEIVKIMDEDPIVRQEVLEVLKDAFD